MGQSVTDVGVEKKEQRRELKKHAATIHCSNSLTLLQRKITNALLYHAYKELMQKEEHEITVKQLCRLIGYQGNNHAAIKEALKGLISTVVEWNLIDDSLGTENWTASSIIASVSLQGPLCYYAYSPRMKQLLHSPSMFGKIDLVIQSQFRSSYGLALYENCIRYRGLPHSKWLDMDTFRKLMGVPAGMYDVFRDFKRRVVDKAVEEVNTYSDLFISLELQKEGRKTTKIRFKLKERAKKSRLAHPANLNALPETGLAEKLKQRYALSEEQIATLLKAYEPAYLEEKIQLVESSKPYQEGRIQNRAGYLLSAIKQNYQQATATQHEVVDLEQAKLELELNQLTRQIEMIRNDYHDYREKTVNKMIEQLPADKKEELMNNFDIFAEQTINSVLRLQRGKYTKETVYDSPQVQALLRQFALRELDDMDVLTLEGFVLEREEERDAWQKLKSLDPDHPLLQQERW